MTNIVTHIQILRGYTEHLASSKGTSEQIWLWLLEVTTCFKNADQRKEELEEYVIIDSELMDKASPNITE